MAVGARLFAIVAADAQILVDQQNVRGFADAIFEQEGGNRRIHVDNRPEAVFLRLDKAVQRLAGGHLLFGLLEQVRLAIQQPLEGSAVQPNDLGLDRRAHGGGAAAAVEQSHFTDVGAGGR
jgi:hypothetical protein